jgi:hypothetical protein
MTVSLKHTFQSVIADSADSSLIQPSNWNAEHQLTCVTSVILGRVTSGTGAVEELTPTQAKGLLAIAVADVTGLQAALDAKQAAGSYAAASHSHVISDVTGLQTALDGKQAAGSYEASGTAASAIAAHVAAVNPHPDYLTEAEADALYAPLGGGGGVSYGTATIDFGAFPGSNEASVTFTNAAVGAAVSPFFASNDTTTDHTANDHKYAAMLVQLSTQTTPGVGGVIHARSQHKMQGTFDVRYGY